ncbi:hypothetical protein HNR19_003885 [Nocardioides thalensis]|uniref:MoaF-like domain-containing protein n=1 Tax=Nocardioides thalensis TaxID=1914755 RepID=A0A853C7A6_9ACTN|nr:hypothetical protein [Nocardioides thalensis]NYJ03187.1 hypothetical protein [Nocardioides thalensis]
MPTALENRTFHFDLGGLKVRYTFEPDDKATFVVTDGAGLAPDGHTETVAITATEIRPNVWLNAWREANGSTVTHVEDFEKGVLYSNVTVDGQLYTLTGTIKEI